MNSILTAGNGNEPPKGKRPAPTKVPAKKSK